MKNKFKYKRIVFGIVGVLIVVGIYLVFTKRTKIGYLFDWDRKYSHFVSDRYEEISDDFMKRLVEAAIDRTKHKVRYEASYRQIDYPSGDVPEEFGVCTDVIIRSYRQLGIDLQVDVHEDMEENFELYPKLWGLETTDTNIDHRRVPNLLTYFSRFGEVLPITQNPDDYKPGDLVTWNLGKGLTHIGIVTNKISKNNTRYIVHNIGSGPKLDDCIFDWKITGHFRYYGKQ